MRLTLNTWRFNRITIHLRTPLLRNAYLLASNTLLTAGIGFLYWLIAARIYSTEQIGFNAAVISDLIYIVGISSLSPDLTLRRFVPIAGNQTGLLVFYVYGISILIAMGSVLFSC